MYSKAKFTLVKDTPGISWHPVFASQSPMMKRTYFLCVSSRSLIGLHRTIQPQLLQHYWLGHGLGLLWHWFALEMNRDHSVIGCHSVTSPEGKKCLIWEVIWGTVFKSQEMRTPILQITYITFHNQGKRGKIKENAK